MLKKVVNPCGSATAEAAKSANTRAARMFSGRYCGNYPQSHNKVTMAAETAKLAAIAAKKMAELVAARKKRHAQKTKTAESSEKAGESERIDEFILLDATVEEAEQPRTTMCVSLSCVCSCPGGALTLFAALFLQRCNVRLETQRCTSAVTRPRASSPSTPSGCMRRLRALYVDSLQAVLLL